MADRDPNDPDTWIERHRVGTEPLSRLPCQCIFPGCTRKADGVAPFPSYGVSSRSAMFLLVGIQLTISSTLQNAKKHVQKHLELMLRHFCDYCDWSSYNKGVRHASTFPEPLNDSNQPISIKLWLRKPPNMKERTILQARRSMIVTCARLEDTTICEHCDFSMAQNDHALTKGFRTRGAAQRFHESLCGARGDRELNYAGRNWDRKQGGFVYLVRS